MEPDGALLSSTLFLDGVGDVLATLTPHGMSWRHVHHESNASACLVMRHQSNAEVDIKFSDVYAVEFIDWGSIHNGVCSEGGHPFYKKHEMYCFAVHGFHRGRFQRSPWVLSAYTFGHKDLLICQTWVEQLNASMKMEIGRPKSLLVFVHPLCGKGNGRKIWEAVAPIFSRANVKTKVMVTQRAGHAFDVITSSTGRELSAFDGIISVGGDGLFSEVLNGLLSSRHKSSYPPTPKEFNLSGHGSQTQQAENNNSSDCWLSSNILSSSLAETSHKNDDHEPLLSVSECGVGISKSSMYHMYNVFFEPNYSSNIHMLQVRPDMFKCVPSIEATKNGPVNTDNDPVLTFPNDWFRLGLIPAGSTDSIVVSTTGVRDPVTSALQIVLGKRILLDIAQIVRWTTSPLSKDLPSVHYAASFVGYGFYGDVIKESEKLRWMGPKRYDYAGTKVFLEHRSYEAEVACIDSTTANPVTGIGGAGNGIQQQVHEEDRRMVCCRNCAVCDGPMNSAHLRANGTTTRSNIDSDGSRWLRFKGRFISVGAAIISCRNDRAPDGLVADAHLSDGFLHLILIKECPRPLYLWHLIQLTRKGGKPLSFEFVEHHKTTAFTFVSSHNESVWNLDGELFQACKVSAQVCRGLVNLFASGPEA